MVQTLGWQMILGVIKTPETVRVVKGCPGNKKNMDWHMRAKIKKNRVFGTSEAEAGQKKNEYWLAESLDNHREINLIDIFPVTGVGRRGKNTPIWYWMYIKKRKEWSLLRIEKGCVCIAILWHLWVLLQVGFWASITVLNYQQHAMLPSDSSWSVREELEAESLLLCRAGTAGSL